MVSKELIRRIRQEFRLSWYGIHGISHWIRVRDNGLRLARMTGVNIDVIELFAFLHDARRLNDDKDLDHGRRAAKLVRALRDSVILLPTQDFECLVFACEYHSDGLREASVTVQTCWDADRLDLGRVGIKPEARYLCTLDAQEQTMIEWAFLRSRQTRHGQARSK